MLISREGVFFAGQTYDASIYFRDILQHSKTEFVLIDGYISDKVLDMISAKQEGVKVKILTKQTRQSLISYGRSFNQQFGGLEIRESNDFHDRFVIVDDTDYYHFGHSIKDLGTKGFMFSRIEEPPVKELINEKWRETWQNARIVLP